MEQPVDADSELGYEPLDSPWWVVLLEGIFAIIVGLFLLYSPAITTVILIQVLGIFWLAGGILSVLGAFVFSGNRMWKLLSGILSIIAGIVILTYPIYSPFIVLTLFVIFIGVWAIISGAVKLVSGLKGEGWGTGILGIVTIILGLLLLANTLVGALALPWVFGIFLVIGGIGGVIGGLKMRT
ncbi:MAG: HdeD family acid-resistance protein [Methanosarcina mazei]|nr:HdeD family acid-resistance protein [Methanosarcina mazei]